MCQFKTGRERGDGRVVQSKNMYIYCIYIDGECQRDVIHKNVYYTLIQTDRHVFVFSVSVCRERSTASH